MRYRKKEIGCEIRYSELDSRAMKYIEEFENIVSERTDDDCDEKDENQKSE